MPAELLALPVSAADAGLRDALLAAELPIDDIADGGRRFFRFQYHGEIVGYGGFEPHGRYALVRSIAVDAAQRGQGIGRAITEAIMAEAKRGGAAEAFLLTTTAGPFFEHLGFAAMDRADAPAEILATRQATTICSTAALLARPLDDA